MSTAAGAVPAIPAPGFADPTRDAQHAFRAVLDALAHPGRWYDLAGPDEPPAALGRGLGAVALTVLDDECTLWLDPALAADADVTAWLAFHTGARPAAHAAEADFVIAGRASRPALDALTAGTDEDPHRSATLLLDVRGADGGARFTASGPGIDGSTVVDAPWADQAFAGEWARNTGLFPRGVDVLLVDDTRVAGLPRTTRLVPTTTHPAEEA